MRIASGLKVSLFLLAVVFTGIEFDDVFLGVAFNLEDLGGVALGMVLGTTLSMSGVVLALAAILTPTEVRIPRDYLLIFGAAPLVAIAFALMAPLTAVHGALLLGLFAVFLGYVTVRETGEDTPVFRDAELCEAYASRPAVRAGAGGPAPAPGPGERPAPAPRRDFSASLPFAGTSGWSGLALAVLALAGLLAGAAATGIGTDGILRTYHLEGTVFGATIATAVLTVEDVFLTVEPARRGAPEIGVGNVIGSVVFSVTGKLGVILLAGSLVVGGSVLTWHLPALVVVTGLAACFLATGRLRRWHGYVLLGLYAGYWIVSLTAFGGAPVDD